MNNTGFYELRGQQINDREVMYLFFFFLTTRFNLTKNIYNVNYTFKSTMQQIAIVYNEDLTGYTANDNLGMTCLSIDMLIGKISVAFTNLNLIYCFI